MNALALIPVVTTLWADREPTWTLAYMHNRFTNPGGYRCEYHWSIKYGRSDVWLVRILGISQTDLDALAAKPDVYMFPDIAALDTPITDKARIDTFFESFNIPTNWTTASTTYRQLLRALGCIGVILAKYYGIRWEAGVRDELLELGVTLETRFRNLGAAQQAALQQAINELAGQTVPINQNMTLRTLLNLAREYMQSYPLTLMDLVI